MRSLFLLLAIMLCAQGGCVIVQPGHRGLYFEPSKGLHRDVLLPGRHWTGLTGKVEDFDITYSTRKERISTTSSEGLQLDLHIAVIYRPVISELYQLLTEIGSAYYEEVIGPEFRSAARGIFARHSYVDVLRRNEHIENEIEKTVQRRCAGKHIEIASVTLESIQYAPEILRAVSDRLVAEQDAGRQKTLLQNESMRSRMRAEQSLFGKQKELELARAQAEVDKVREESEAAKRVLRAKAQAEAEKLIAAGEMHRARAHTQLSVMAGGYDALKALAGSNVQIMLGDWSKVPSFLFPGANPLAGARR